MRVVGLLVMVEILLPKRMPLICCNKYLAPWREVQAQAVLAQLTATAPSGTPTLVTTVCRLVSRFAFSQGKCTYELGGGISAKRSDEGGPGG